MSKEETKVVMSVDEMKTLLFALRHHCMKTTGLGVDWQAMGNAVGCAMNYINKLERENRMSCFGLKTIRNGMGCPYLSRDPLLHRECLTAKHAQEVLNEIFNEPEDHEREVSDK